MLNSLSNTINDPRILIAPTHHSCLDHVEGRAEACGGETGHEGADEVQGHVVLEGGVLHEHLLVLIVGGDFGGVDDTVTQDVGDDTHPEAWKAALSVDLAVAINGALVFDLRGVSCTGLGLEFDLDHIGGVGDGDTNGAGHQGCEDLGAQGGVLTWLEFAGDQSSDWDVETDTETSEDDLTLEAWGKSVIQCSGTFLARDSLHGAKETLIFGSDIGIYLL